MKNIHVLPTEKPSVLKQNNITKKISLVNKEIDLTAYTPINIYITSDEEIKEGDWVFDIFKNAYPDIKQLKTEEEVLGVQKTEFKIILTTDQELIKDGVQAIDYEFLEWFIKNPSCEKVDWCYSSLMKDYEYEIIIPKEEPKQETLEEAAEKFAKKFGIEIDSTRYYAFINGAKWQQDNSNINALYFEIDALKKQIELLKYQEVDFNKWFEQFKNK